MVSIFTNPNIPMAAILSYHSEERQLYARMVLTLNMDANRSMEVIAFWLWLEEKGHTDVIHRVNAFDDQILQVIAILGQTFVDAIRLDLQQNHPSRQFREEAAHGIIYYLNHVCLKVLGDIRKQAEDKENHLDQMEMLVRMMSQTSLDNYMIVHQGTSIKGRPHNVLPYVPHGEGSSGGAVERRLGTIPSITEVERQVLSGYPFNLHKIEGTRPFQEYYCGADLDPVTTRGNDQHQQHSLSHVQENLPREERTLFVTFSNGYPLTEAELYYFFMR